MCRLSFTLAAANPGELFPTVLPWLIVILVVAVVGALVIWGVRRMLRSDSGGDAPGFTLQSLRDLRDQGQISDEEYQRAREAMISRVKRDAETSKPAVKEPDESTATEGGPANGADSDKAGA